MITALLLALLVATPQEDPRPAPPPSPAASPTTPSRAPAAAPTAGSSRIPTPGASPSSAEPAATPKAPAPARPDDVATIDGLMAALYASISGPIGAPRDFDRLRSLFAKDAKMISLGQPDGRYVPRTMTVEGYIAASGKLLVEKGFSERELHRREDRFGHLFHVWSTYEGRLDGQDRPFVRGINSLQLAHDGTRFWILSLVWDPETPSNPLPPSALPPSAPPK